MHTNDQLAVHGTPAPGQRWRLHHEGRNLPRFRCRTDYPRSSYHFRCCMIVSSLSAPVTVICWFFVVKNEQMRNPCPMLNDEVGFPDRSWREVHGRTDRQTERKTDRRTEWEEGEEEEREGQREREREKRESVLFSSVLRLRRPKKITE